MRAEALCIFFALIARKEGSPTAKDDDFRPTAIPLQEWRPEKQFAAGTLHEIIKTETPPTVAAVPAHYWEDALRHSVYLTLVRDKIDQLIAKGAAISTDGNTSGLSKDVDDHDLWEKIKTAPFDRLNEEPSPTGDLSILAKGRLIEEAEGFRFAEDEASRNNCGANNCTKAVKAFWSVKRIRQRDAEPSTGKYHYELTFSVTSQTPQKVKKPFENPSRTFTVKENAPAHPPPVYRPYDSFHRQSSRPQRAIWVHKNIAPAHNYRVRQSNSDLDRIFTSLFSNEDTNEELSSRYKQNTYVPQMYPQYSKVGYVGNRESYHQKKMIPFPAQPPFKYSRPSVQIHSSPPYIQNPYFNTDAYVNSPHITAHAENAFTSSAVKTTRPPVLPTPVAPSTLIKESTVETPITTLYNKTDAPKPAEPISTYKMYKMKQTAPKISYSSEHVRPPVYNAPPGVFVTMDKKPFKPMPPLKLVHSSKPVKHLPLDFRPSPQVLDNQSSDPDTAPDTAFRPIAMNSNEHVYNGKVITDSGKKGNKNSHSHSKKPPKKQDKVKPYRITTIAPEIITAHDDSDMDIEWTSILGAFSKTTPMASQKEKTTTTESTNVAATTTAPITIAETDPEVTELEYTVATPLPTTTTPLPKKRTRPPPKFKQEIKVKKHKRVMTTTTTTTTKPLRKFTVPSPTEDLKPQASSAPKSGANSVWDARNKTESVKITTSSNAKVTLTTTRPTTTTYPTTSPTTLSTTVETKPPVATTQPKSKNRFRQSMVMQKGTSVNHDKWYNKSDKNQTTSHSEKLYLRRKASQFHGYISSTPKIMDKERNKADHEDNVFYSKYDLNSTESFKDDTTTNTITTSTQTSIDEYGDNIETTVASIHKQSEKGASSEESGDNDNSSKGQESNDDSEFIFQMRSTTPENESFSDSSDNTSTIQSTTVTSHVETKNKTKCKKKKHNNLSTTEVTPDTSSEVIEITTTNTLTENVTTPDFLEELLGGFTMDSNSNDEPKLSASTIDADSEGSQSIKHEQFIGDDSLDRFLESLEVKGNYQTESDEQTETDYDESSDISIEESPFDNDEDDDNDSVEARYDDYYESKDSKDSQPYSLLELMAME